MTTPGMGFYERIWRERCGYAWCTDDAVTEPVVLEADGEVPILVYPRPWKRDPALREVVYAAALALLYRERVGDEQFIRAALNHPVLARAVAEVAGRDEDAA